MAEYRLRMREFPLGERPRERLRDYGPESLADSELLAILLRVGVQGMNVIQLAQMLLHEYGGLRGLQRASFQELQDKRGMGEAKTAQLKAALEIGRRMAMLSFQEKVQVKHASDIVKLLDIEMAHLDQEHLRAVCLDVKNNILKIHTIYIGNICSAQVRVSEVFKESIRVNSSAIILVHNHPTGDPTPSQDDILVTHQIVTAGRLLDIEVLDHLIIGSGQYTSLRELEKGGFD